MINNRKMVYKLWPNDMIDYYVAIKRGLLKSWENVMRLNW